MVGRLFSFWNGPFSWWHSFMSFFGGVILQNPQCSAENWLQFREVFPSSTGHYRRLKFKTETYRSLRNVFSSSSIYIPPGLRAGTLKNGGSNFSDAVCLGGWNFGTRVFISESGGDEKVSRWMLKHSCHIPCYCYWLVSRDSCSGLFIVPMHQPTISNHTIIQP